MELDKKNNYGILIDVFNNNLLNLRFKSQKAQQERFIKRILSEDEIRQNPDFENRLCFAITKHLKNNDEKRYKIFDSLGYLDYNHYKESETKWLQDEKYHLGLKLHHEPRSEEMIDDIIQSDIGHMYRTWYAIKYPGKMKKMRDIPSPVVSL